MYPNCCTIPQSRVSEERKQRGQIETQKNQISSTPLPNNPWRMERNRILIAGINPISLQTLADSLIEASSNEKDEMVTTNDAIRPFTLHTKYYSVGEFFPFLL
jgi:hypothetical protein